MSKLCRIVIDTDRRLANTIAQLLIDRSVNFSIREIAEPLGGTSAIGPAPRREANGVPSWQSNEKAQHAAQAILDQMKPGETYSHKALAGAIVPMGYKETSISPLLSAMARAGKVQRVGRGKYRLAGSK